MNKTKIHNSVFMIQCSFLNYTTLPIFYPNKKSTGEISAKKKEPSWRNLARRLNPSTVLRIVLGLPKDKLSRKLNFQDFKVQTWPVVSFALLRGLPRSGKTEVVQAVTKRLPAEEFETLRVEVTDMDIFLASAIPY